MSKFCDECPLQYQAKGEIVGIVYDQWSYETRAVLGRGALLDSYNGSIGVLYDNDNNPSSPMKFPIAEPLDVLERYLSRIDSCSGPIIETKGLIRKKQYITACPALGAAAVKSGEVSFRVLKQCHTELL